jgi:stage II sporulation protein D
MRLLAALVLWGYGLAHALDLRVLLGEVTGEARVLMAGPHRGQTDTGHAFETHYALAWPASAEGDTLLVDGAAIGRSLTLTPTDGSPVSYAGRQYRGSLRLLASEGRVLVLNVLDLETYLRGVVPAEMQASWPMGALRAQAVAARSYALTALAPEADYDICATILCQHYGGVAYEHPRSDQAILDTRGLILTHGGRVAVTYYHADSGGVLASGAEVWGEAAPYLPAQADVESSTPHRGWQLTLDPRQVAAALREYGHDLGDVSSVRVLELSESGRVKRAAFEGSRGRAELGGQDLTKLLRGLGLKSTRLRLEGFVARGDGWGHGVGMSQYGAKALSEAGYGFEAILAFYYPETHLQQVSVLALGD